MTYSANILRNIVEKEILLSNTLIGLTVDNFIIPNNIKEIEEFDKEDQNLMLAIQNQLNVIQQSLAMPNGFLADVEVMKEVVKHINVTTEILNYLINVVDSRVTNNTAKIGSLYDTIFLTYRNNDQLIADLTTENLTKMAGYVQEYDSLSKIIGHQNSNIDTFILAFKNVFVGSDNRIYSALSYNLFAKFASNQDDLCKFAVHIENEQMFLVLMRELDPANAMHKKVLDALGTNKEVDNAETVVNDYVNNYIIARNLRNLIEVEELAAQESRLRAESQADLSAQEARLLAQSQAELEAQAAQFQSDLGDKETELAQAKSDLQAQAGIADQVTKLQLSLGDKETELAQAKAELQAQAGIADQVTKLQSELADREKKLRQVKKLLSDQHPDVSKALAEQKATLLAEAKAREAELAAEAEEALKAREAELTAEFEADLKALEAELLARSGRTLAEEREFTERVENILNNTEIPLHLVAFREHCVKAARSLATASLNISGNITVDSEQEAEFIAEVKMRDPATLDAIADRVSLSDPVSIKNLAKFNPEIINKIDLRLNQ